jgi:hypothetical protein
MRYMKRDDDVGANLRIKYPRLATKDDLFEYRNLAGYEELHFLRVINYINGKSN